MKKFKLIFITIILFIYLLFVGGRMPYFIFYIFLSTLLVPLIHLFFVNRNLTGSVDVPKKTINIGDKVKIGYLIRNSSKLTAPYIEIENTIIRKLSGSDSKKTIITLKPRDYYKHDEEVLLKRRGYYELGDIEVIIKDVFGLYSIRKKISSKTSLLVYPKPVELSSFRIKSMEQLGDIAIEDKAFQDRSRVSSLRTFREGDSVKSIYWKMSAKMDKLIVKEFDNSADTRVTLVINNFKDIYENDINYRLEDKVADIGISIINYYINKNIHVNFLSQDVDKLLDIQGNQKMDIKHFFEAFAKFKANGVREFSAFLKERINAFNRNSTVIIITPELNKSIGSIGILLKTNNIEPIFIVVMDRENNIGTIDHIVVQSLRDYYIPVYVLDYDTNIKEALEE